MPFQVVELRLDAEDQVIDRRAIPYPYPQRLDAVDTIKKLTARLDKAHYEAERDFLVGCRQRRENAAQICHRRRLTMFGSKHYGHQGSAALKMITKPRNRIGFHA